MTSQENERLQYRPEDHYREDEISLIDLLLVIWKWKWLIIVGVVVSVVSAAVISFQMPRVYDISMFVEPGIVGVDEVGNILYSDSSANISNKIAGGVYNRKLEEMFSQQKPDTHITFRSALVKGSKVIKISSRWNEEKTDLGIKVSRRLLNLLDEEYETVIQPIRNNYEQQITQRLNSLENIQSVLKLQQAMSMKVKQRKEELLEEMRGVQENINKILQQRNSYRQSDSDRSSFLILHSMVIEQNGVYRQLKYQVFDLEIREKDIEVETIHLKKSIDDVVAEMNDLKYKKGLISNIKVVQQPEVSPNPVAPKKKQIILLAGMASLLIFIFLAFFIEYIRNARCPAGMK